MFNFKNDMSKKRGIVSFTALALLFSSYGAYSMDPPVEEAQPTQRVHIQDKRLDQAFSLYQRSAWLGCQPAA